jgi:hypothetical protein
MLEYKEVCGLEKDFVAVFFTILQVLQIELSMMIDDAGYGYGC